jgi:hypothetical protein
MNVRRLAASRDRAASNQDFETRRIEMLSRKLPSHLVAAGTLALAAALAIALALAAPAAAGAQLPQSSRLFLLSSCYTCAHHNPTIAGNAAGDFLASWVEPVSGLSEGVFARFFQGAQAPLGDDFQVASGGPGTPPQFDGAAAADAKGNFVLAWASIVDDQSAILAQRFDARGNPLGGQISVASDAASSPSSPADFKPAVAATPDGGFVVAWISLANGDQPADSPRVMMRAFDSTGAAGGPAVQLNTGLALSDRPSVCVSATGRVHAAWSFADVLLPFQPSPVGVVVRRIAPGGAPLGPEQVVAPAVDSETSVAVGCGPGNTYVVAWQTAQPPAAAGSDIVAQRFTRRGRAVGSTFVLNQLTDGDQKNPALVFDATGALVAVWEGNPGGVAWVRGRRFAGDGTPLSDEFRVYNAGRGYLNPMHPALSALGPGNGFVVGVDGPGGLIGRTFSVNGSAGSSAAAGAADDAGPGAVVDGGAASTGNGRGAGGLW